MSEHSPAPTPARAVYGFALFLLSHTLFIIYLIYAYVPKSILEDKLGLYYLPDKYFALIIPVLFLVCLTLFAFFIYPSINLMMTPRIDQLETITDKYQIFRCNYINKEGKMCDNLIENCRDEHWNTEKYCKYHNTEYHNIDRQNFTPEVFCDCPKSLVCLLKENPDHLNTLQNRNRIPAVRDLDIADVFDEMFN
ncbi:uncharacterized protein LOC129608864 [Condylostylus longicornis]|uniref:uncharacterized protein LOC129608864 n=1 Tax=Condylostylus longicornis TaxID=2530218 RepID=UPI00244E4A77|nr:uncharacterized protein LOC129608864 [Condylostylus longicornis]